MTTQMIPAASCILSAKNVRRTPASPASLDQFKADIASHGVLQNLIGFAISKKKGKFEITAGGRRLAAVQALIADGVFPADTTIPVFVMNDASTATATSLAENFQRQPMNPCDECNAFRHLVETEGKSIDEVAHAYGLTSRFVAGRIRLAGLAEEVFEALHNDEISLEMAQAFATTSDVSRQSAVFAQYKGSYGFNPANIRRAMIDETITATHPLALLAGRDAYLASGGRIETDLFGSAADEIWLNRDLVRTLGEARMTTAAAAITGFGNVVPVLNTRPDWGLTEPLRAYHPERVEPTEAEQAQLDTINNEMEAIETAAEAAGATELSDAETARLEELETAAAALTDRIKQVDESVREAATAFLVIGDDGTPTLHETIYLEPYQVRAGSTATGNTSTAQPAADTGGLGQTLRDELAVQRTQLLGLHLANDPGMAVDLAVFLLADAQAIHYSSDRGSSLSGNAPNRALAGYKPEGQIVDQLQTFSDGLAHSWTEYPSTAARFDAFRNLTEDQRGAWAGWVVARTLEPKLADEKHAAFHNHLGTTLGIDTAAWWRPTSANFFNRVKKDVVLDALRDIGGDELRGRYANAKKGDLAVAAEKLCAGGAIVEAGVRAKALAWVPTAMTFGVTAITVTSSDAPIAATRDGETPDPADGIDDNISKAVDEDLEQAA